MSATRPVPVIPPQQFLWGFNVPYHVTKADMEKLRDTLSINTVRFFVTPSQVGLPQKTYNGPESIDYRRFTDTDYDWTWLDSKLSAARETGVMPILLPFPVDEYVSRMYMTNLTSLNNQSAGIDYTGLIPEEQVKVFSVAIAKHVATHYPDLEFGIVYTELWGRGDAAAARSGEAAAWKRIVHAIKQSAPRAHVYSPEVLASQHWNSTAREYGCGNYGSLYYGPGWPLTDTVENYASSFDNLAISFYGITKSDSALFCPKEDRMQPTLDTALAIVRDHAASKPFLWSEVGWGNDDDPASCSTDDMNLNWASFLLGGDHMRGVLLWQGRQLTEWKCAALDAEGNFTRSIEALSKIATVIRENYAFFATRHEMRNADGLPINDASFSEEDPATFTRRVGNYILMYPTEGSYWSLTFSNTQGRIAKEFLNTSGAPLYIGALDMNRTVVQPLKPNRLYILRVD